MNVLNIKSTDVCEKDLISLGEVLLRFDPGDMRIHNARQFFVWDGGAEYNVARNLSRVFHQRTAIVTALADNPLGRLAEDFIRQAGVDASRIIWTTDPSKIRNGIYFIERGFGIRAPDSCFDRGNTAVSHLKPGDIDWSSLFGEGTRWFHTGGVFTGISEDAPGVAIEAMKAARESGAIVSYDLNYRDSLWKTKGGREAANAQNRILLEYADVVFGVFDFETDLSKFDKSAFQSAARKMFADFPNLNIIASTLREVQSASWHDFSAVCATREQVFKADDYTQVQVLDRVGSGDAFASGFIYGLLSGKDLQFAVECGTAHGAIKMTTPGDGSMATLTEVLGHISGSSAHVKR